MTQAAIRIGLKHLALWGMGALALSSCGTPQPPEPPRERFPRPQSSVVPAGQGGTLAIGKDGYPTFAAPLTAANTQMSDQGAASLQKQLEGLSAQRRAGTISEAEYQRRVREMRRLIEQQNAGRPDDAAQ